MTAHLPTVPVPKIYGFVNNAQHEWYVVDALSEDGVFLAQHVCSHPCFGPHDIGVTSNWQHEHYLAYYPQGFEVVWVEDAKTDERLKAAYAAHLALTKDEYAAKYAPVLAAREAREAGREAEKAQREAETRVAIARYEAEGQ